MVHGTGEKSNLSYAQDARQAAGRCTAAGQAARIRQVSRGHHFGNVANARGSDTPLKVAR